MTPCRIRRCRPWRRRSAAIRATREATVKQKGETAPCIAGIPEAGETIGKLTFDGKTEAAIFPGDLPVDPTAVFTQNLEGSLKFVKFRPPILGPQGFPQIRLDRVAGLSDRRPAGMTEHPRKPIGFALETDDEQQASIKASSGARALRSNLPRHNSAAGRHTPDGDLAADAQIPLGAIFSRQSAR